MSHGLFKIISNSIQRWPVIPESEKNSLIHRIVRTAARRAYCTFFLFAKDRRKVNATFWGGEGGYIHAMAKFDQDNEDWQKTYTQFAAEISKHLNSGTRILELGCSAGQWCRRLQLSTKAGAYTGVDINPKTIEFAKQKFANERNVTFYAEDLIDFDKYDDFDMVMVCQTFFFLDRDTLLSVLKKIRSGTLLIFQEPVNDDFKKQKSTVLMKYPLNKAGTGFSHNYSDILADLGFNIMQEKIIERGASDQKKLLITARKN